MLVFIAYSQAQGELPFDKKATKQTVAIYKNLKKVVNKGFMIGHQDDLAYGVNWKYQPGRSDIKDVTGDYPAVYGWELGHLEIGADVNLDSVPFDKMNAYIREGYQRGGVITISWHGNNPMTGKTAWDPAKGTVTSILPGGEKNDVFKAQLDKIADFLLSLKGKKGELIPVLFRPFHEHTGGWFWWGNATTSNEEYKALFRFTVSYLKDTRQVHNLLYVYNTGSEFSGEKDYLDRYPGDDVVDILSFDTYQGGNAEIDRSYVKSLDFHLSIIEKLANERNKIAVVGETGYNQIPYAKWWTNNLLAGIGNHKIAYVLFWRNAGYKAKEKSMEYYVPYKGQVSEQDFLDFYKLPQTLFQKDICYKKMYK
jgi:hypothetical protein